MRYDESFMAIVTIYDEIRWEPYGHNDYTVYDESLMEIMTIYDEIRWEPHGNNDYIRWDTMRELWQ